MIESGIGATAPEAVLRHANLGVACDRLAEIAARHFADAEAAMAECPRRAMRPARAMAAVYHAQLVRLRRRGWARFAEAVRVPKAIKLWLALRHGLI